MINLHLLDPLYEIYLFKKLSKNPDYIPANLTLVISEMDLLSDSEMHKLGQYISWCRDLHIKAISINIDILEIEDRSMRTQTVSCLLQYLNVLLSKMPKEIGFEMYDSQGNILDRRSGIKINVYIALDFGGRYEITKAVKAVLEEVKAKKIKPQDINEKLIESHLMLKNEPDLFIRTGGTNLSNFMIWQSIYSELIFIDVDWNKFRKIDLLRVLRDFQKRQRRYGK